MIKLEEFCSHSDIGNQKSKIDTAILLIYFDLTFNGNDGITISKLNSLFESAHLASYNITYLKKDLSKDKRVTKIVGINKYKLTYSARADLDKSFLFLKQEEIQIKVRVNLNSTPLLTNVDIDGAQKMSQLYIILYCWENSVRNFTTETLTKGLGNDWWDKTKNKELDRKFEERKLKETNLKWISPRGSENPLFYLDWGDLVKIIRKHENLFLDQIPDIKFIELRLEELERLRNIIAHNGLVPDDNDIDRIIVHFNDWCNQLKK